MKVLFILPEYYPHSGGGIATYYLNYIKALQPHCDKIKVIAGSGYTNGNDSFTHEGAEVEYLKPGVYQKYLHKFTRFNLSPEFKQNMTAAWAMHEQANAGDGFDIIECTDFGLGFIPWVIQHQKPVITRLHGSSGQISWHETNQSDNLLTDFTKQTELLLLPDCDVLISHSTANQTFWNQQFATKPVIKIAPVFYSVIQKPAPFTERENYGLVTARIQQWKGPIPLCEALSKMNAAETPQIKWVGRDMLFADKQSTGKYLQERFPQVWNKTIVPQQPVANTQIRELQQQARFGIVPSTWDMFNFTVLEFMAAGTPVICSDGAGAAYLITHGKNGFKYPAMDTGALANCIDQLNKMDSHTYMQMAMAGIETVNEQLSAENIIPQNLQLYKSAVENFKAPSPNQYLETIYMPDDKAHKIDDILKTQPLKLLSSYTLKRLKAKLWAR